MSGKVFRAYTMPELEAKTKLWPCIKDMAQKTSRGVATGLSDHYIAGYRKTVIGLQAVAVFDGSTDGTGGFLPARLGPRASARTGRTLVWSYIRVLDILLDTLEVISSSTRQKRPLRTGRVGPARREVLSWPLTAG
ncbi:hypothetical protein B0H19DRAFT_1085364 [Mycena capillaripes]|nr:hypothetical protein B0H19DRAFT_1085364 [Mycena capillaripes]